MVERLSPDELAALSAYDIGVALNEVVATIGVCLRQTRGARDRIMNAKIAALRASDADALVDAKADRIIAETELQHIRDRASALRQWSSILQSLLRAANIT